MVAEGWAVCGNLTTVKFGSTLKSESCSVKSDCNSMYMEFSMPEYWSILKEGSLSLLQGIFPTQWLNPGLLHRRWILYQLRHKGSPRILEWVAYRFSSGSSRHRNQTGISCFAGGFLPTEVSGKPTVKLLLKLESVFSSPALSTEFR